MKRKIQDILDKAKKRGWRPKKRYGSRRNS